MKLWKSLPFVLAITLLAACSQPSAQTPETNTTTAESTVSDSGTADANVPAEGTEDRQR